MRDVSQGYHTRHQQRDQYGRWVTTDPKCYSIGLRLTPRQLSQLATIDGHSATLTDAVLALVDMMSRTPAAAEAGDGPQDAADTAPQGDSQRYTRVATQGAQTAQRTRFVAIRCTRGEYDAIRALCARLGCSPSQCIARALDEIGAASTP